MKDIANAEEGVTTAFISMNQILFRFLKDLFSL
jgi:hypothetical protein